MRIIKKINLMISLVVGLSVFADPVVTDVTAKQRYPWNGLVDITCKVSGIEGKRKFVLSAVMPDSGKVVGLNNFWVVRNGEKSINFEVGANGDYRLLWDAKADLGEVRYDNMVVRIALDDIHDKVQLWEGGPYWATTNIGAEKPEDYGYYFWWGDTVGYKRVNDAWVASDGSSLNFSFSVGNIPTYGKTISDLKSEGWITSDNVLVLTHDAAHIHWGGEWRMPTRDEIEALNNCEWTLTTKNGVNGYIVTGRNQYASKSIFLPAAGCASSSYDAGSRGDYWSSVLTLDDNYRSWDLSFDFSSHPAYCSYRYFGQSIRPVLGRIDVACDFVASGAFRLNTIEDSLGFGLFSFNSSWIGGDSSATIVITDNGVEIYRGSGDGEFEWQPATGGKHTLTYTTYIDDVVQSEVYSATIFADWKYTVNDGKATITETAFVSGNVLVPSEINGYEVTAVADSVFKNSDELVSVTVPSGISMSMIDGVAVIRGNYPCVMGGDAKWANDEDGSLRSGKIGDNSKTWVEMRVAGNGRLTFRWKASTESFYDRKTSLYEYYDYGYLVVDDTPKGGVDDDFALQGVAIGGEIGDWQVVTIDVRGGGEHALRWVYEKDGQDNPALIGEDCIWLNDIVWTPIPDPIPELSATATTAEVSAALEGSADANLAANIKTAAEYEAYRTWALNLESVTPEQVKSSPNAWLFFALDTATLIAAAPTEGDIVIYTFESTANAGAFEFAVKIDGITVGENALGANLRKVFEVEGAETLANGGAGFSTDNVEVNTATPESGNVKFTVTPKMGNGEKPDSFFFRVKMK